MDKRICKYVTLVLLLVHCNVGKTETIVSSGPSLIGIDHMPTVVSNLKEASDAYRHLGFSIKPGRLHEDGLRNSHIKFMDGSGIELISPPATPTDQLTKSYLEFLQQGFGPVYLAFHARDIDKLILALNAAQFRFKNDDGLITLLDPQLNFIFFVRGNRSPTDKPEHFAHTNGAFAMNEVWLALDAETLASLNKLLLSLGAVEHTDTVMTPSSSSAHVFDVQNGRVIALPQNHQLIAGRNIVGVTFCIHKRQLAKQGNNSADSIVQPSASRELWLNFRSEPCFQH